MLFRCYNCGAFLPKTPAPSGDTSEAVGLIGGAALGAAIGGPVGAVIGAIIGAVLGRDAKGAG
jgi:outer membrane lipoprotein SlyB